MNDLILHPRYAALLQEIETLKGELVTVRTQIDHAENVEAQMLKAEYNKYFGVLEHTLVQKYYQARLLKRELELIQAALNRASIPDYAAIDAIIEAEAAEYQAELNKHAEELESSASSVFVTASKEHFAETKQLYQKIVRALHPDLNPAATEADRASLQQAMEAFSEGDISTLDAIAAILELQGKFQKKAPSGTLEDLETKRQNLFNTLSSLAQKLQKIHSSFPFDCEKLLESPEFIHEKTEELKTNIANYETLIQEYQNRLNQQQRRQHE
ncbi:MAG: hypothetical protein J6W22_06415 [Fibrobacter sp.]|nr:hypothetical protein [Fibrobacter sp.]